MRLSRPDRGCGPAWRRSCWWLTNRWRRSCWPRSPSGRGMRCRPSCATWPRATSAMVEGFVSAGQEVRLTQAALEPLAVVAYRQPVSRARVSAVRGVNCDGVMRTLGLRGLVEESGTDHETGAILYRTTGYFLERLGLAGLEELPELAPFLPDDIEDSEDPVDRIDHEDAADERTSP